MVRIVGTVPIPYIQYRSRTVLYGYNSFIFTVEIQYNVVYILLLYISILLSTTANYKPSVHNLFLAFGAERAQTHPLQIRTEWCGTIGVPIPRAPAVRTAVGSAAKDERCHVGQVAIECRAQPKRPAARGVANENRGAAPHALATGTAATIIATMAVASTIASAAAAAIASAAAAVSGPASVPVTIGVAIATGVAAGFDGVQ